MIEIWSFACVFDCQWIMCGVSVDGFGVLLSGLLSDDGTDESSLFSADGAKIFFEL